MLNASSLQLQSSKTALDLSNRHDKQGCMVEARWQGLLRGMHVGMGRAGRHVRACGPEEKAGKWEWGLLGSI